LLDASSGNTGIAYAMLGAAAGVDVTICIPANASPERKALLEVYGAEVILTSRLDGTEGATVRARELVAEQPDRYYFADQYSNPANTRAHRETTGPEIWAQTAGKVTHFVAAMGTTGTMMGTGGFLKEKNPAVRLIGVQPDSPYHGLEGLKHLATTTHLPALYDAAKVDGANRWQRFWHVTLPGLRPVLLFVITITILASANMFGQSYLLTEGGPGEATQTAVMYIAEEGLRNYRMGSAAAMSYVLASFLVVISILFFVLLRRKEH
jgi:hypothetical protein